MTTKPATFVKEDSFPPYTKGGLYQTPDGHILVSVMRWSESVPTVLLYTTDENGKKIDILDRATLGGDATLDEALAHFGYAVVENLPEEKP